MVHKSYRNTIISFMLKIHSIAVLPSTQHLGKLKYILRSRLSGFEICPYDVIYMAISTHKVLVSE